MAPMGMQRLVLMTLVLLAALSLANAGRRRSSRRGAKVEKDDSGTKTAASDDGLTEKEREAKAFSLFYIVQFSNEGCRSNSAISGGGTGSTARNGTCFTSTECSDKGGTAAGSCASGFGVCCVFLVSNSGSTINQNCTYIRNPGYPSAYSSTSSVQYTVNKCSNNVCKLRLDFESFTIQGTGNTEEYNADATPPAGGTCLDTFDVQVTTGQRIPTICGQNTGQHMYVDIGQLGSDTAQLNFAFSGTASRTWEIKVTQIPCYGACSKGYNPPDGCLQWHTGLTGRLTTYNFLPTNDNHLANQDYSICVRQEEGYCCVQYQLCQDTNSFTLEPAIAMAKQDATCTLDYVAIPDSSNSCLQGGTPTPVKTKYCGANLNSVDALTENNPICDCTQPFIVDIFTDILTETGDEATANLNVNRGLCLEYTQIPCV